MKIRTILSASLVSLFAAINCAAEEIVTIPKERQQELNKIEGDFFKRLYLDPVIEALQDESEENREAWKGMLQTAEDSLYYMSGGMLPVWREYIGRGAVDAYEKGCNYPLPIGYAYSSLIKKKDKIKEAFRRAYLALEDDKRWNAATRLQFGAFFLIGGNRDEELYPSAEEIEFKYLKRFLLETEWSEDEVGAVWFILQFAVHGEITPAFKAAESEGKVFDPWLKLMVEAEDAHHRAWAARGNGFASTVTEEGWKIYGEEIVKVLPLCEKAYALRPDLPQSTHLALKTCYGNSDEMQLWLNRAKACRYDYLVAYSDYIFGSRPRWGGRTEKMAKLCIDLAKEGEFETMVPLFAYEKMVGNVFEDEGGIVMSSGRYKNADQFVAKAHKIYSRYFDGYRKSRYANEKACFIEKVHIAVALADLAWRLENAEEFDYWTKRVEELKMPVNETHFNEGYRAYAKYLPRFKELDKEKREIFLRGVRALDSKKDGEALDKLVELAKEKGYNDLLLSAALLRGGKIDLRPHVTMQSSSGQTLNLVLRGDARNHMIYRVKVKADAHSRGTTYFNANIQASCNGKRTEGITALCFRGHENYMPNWYSEEQTCAFELEILNDKVRLTQEGELHWEKELPGKPTECSFLSIYSFFNPKIEIETLELEFLGNNDTEFTIKSAAGAKRKRVIPPPTPKTNFEKIDLPAINGVKPCYQWQDTTRESGVSPISFRTMNNGYTLSCDQMRSKEMVLSFPQKPTKGFTVLMSVEYWYQKGEEYRLLGVKMKGQEGNEDRMSVRADMTSLQVSAVAQNAVKRWTGSVPLKKQPNHSILAFTYDYQHGLSAYQMQNGEWVELVSAVKCRYKGEEPIELRFGPLLDISGVFLYPTRLDLPALKSLPLK